MLAPRAGWVQRCTPGLAKCPWALQAPCCGELCPALPIQYRTPGTFSAEAEALAFCQAKEDYSCLMPLMVALEFSPPSISTPPFWEGIVFNVLAFSHTVDGGWVFSSYCMNHHRRGLGAALKLARPECHRARVTSA